MNEVLELRCTETTCIRSVRDSRNRIKRTQAAVGHAVKLEGVFYIHLS